MLKKLKSAAGVCGVLTIISGCAFLAGMAFEATRKPAILIILALMAASAVAYSRLHEEISLHEFKLRRSLPEEFLCATVISRRKWRWYRVVNARGGFRVSDTNRISHYVTFDIEEHGEVELLVSAEIYHAVQIGMTGQLQCKNEVCVGFESQD